MTTIEGHCHCENLRIRFTTGRDCKDLNPVECPCRFCRSHGVIYAADNAGRMAITAERAQQIICYRFGVRTTVYLICGHCGGLVAALVSSGDELFGAMNLSMTANRPASAYSDEAWKQQSAAERLAYRLTRWTPATLTGFSLSDDS